MTIENKDESPESRRGYLYAFLPVGLIVASLVGNFVMIRIATADPAFAVERDYYKKAISWDDAMAQEKRNAELGFAFKVEDRKTERGIELGVVVLDKDGQPITGAKVTGEAFPNARAGDIRTLDFAPEGVLHRVEIPNVRPGLWEIRLKAEVKGATFTGVDRRDLNP